jgi:hypothetical protein
MEQAAKSTITLGALSVLLVIVGIWGWNAATEPFPAKTEPPKCVSTTIEAGEKVFPQQVTVSVLNASDRNGLAGRTMGQLADQGFNEGDTGNAPGNARVEAAARDTQGVGVTVVVGDDFSDVLPGKKAVVAGEDAEICSPPVS